MIETIGMIAGTVVPFFNIPLILRIKRRKSSKDISVTWIIGVWVCTLFMLPAALASESASFKCFTIVNFVLVSFVVYYVFRYRKGGVVSKEEDAYNE